MPSILPGVRFSVKEELCKQLRRCRLALVRIRYLIVINLLNGRSAYQTAEVLGVHNTTVYRVAGRFRAYGAWGLWKAGVGRDTGRPGHSGYPSRTSRCSRPGRHDGVPRHSVHSAGPAAELGRSARSI